MICHPKDAETSAKRTMDHFLDVDHDANDVTATLALQTERDQTRSSFYYCIPQPQVSHIECRPLPILSLSSLLSPQDYADSTTDIVPRLDKCDRDRDALGLGPRSREQLNQVISRLAGSATYGLTDKGFDLLKGRLVCLDVVGDARVIEHSGLGEAGGAAMHIIKITSSRRQHNLIAEKLALLNPQWSEEMVFNETRKIVIAQVQHISYPQFLPSLFGPTGMKDFGLDQIQTEPDCNDDPGLDLGSYFHGKWKEASGLMTPSINDQLFEFGDCEDFSVITTRILSGKVQNFESFYKDHWSWNRDLFPGENVDELPTLLVKRGLVVDPTFESIIGLGPGQTFRNLKSCSDRFWFELIINCCCQLLGNWQQVCRYLNGTSESDPKHMMPLPFMLNPPKNCLSIPPSNLQIVILLRKSPPMNMLKRCFRGSFVYSKINLQF